MSLKSKAISGAKWTAYSTVINTAAQFLQLFVLGRLLSPEAFGLMAILMVILGFAQAYSDMGVSQAIIHKQNVSELELSSLYWLNMLIGGIIFTVIFLFSSFISSFFQDEGLDNLLRLVGVVFVITPFGNQFQVLLQKELKFKLIAIVDIAGAFLGLIVSILIALYGFGVLALIWGYISTSFCRSILFIFLGIKNWRPQLKFDFFACKPFINFGLFQMGERSVNYFAANLDYILIGKFIGTEVLGLYSIAYQILIRPITKINPILTRIAFPLFSRVQDDDKKLSDGYIVISKIVSLTTVPIIGVLVLTSDEYILFFLGEGWSSSVIYIYALSFVAVFRSLANPSGSIILAKGRADVGFYWNVYTAIFNLVVFYSVIMMTASAFKLGLAFSILTVLYFFQTNYLLNKIASLDLRKYYSTLLRPFSIAVVSCILLVVAKKEIIFLKSLNSILLLAVILILYIIILIGGLYLFERKIFVSILKQIKLARKFLE